MTRKKNLRVDDANGTNFRLRRFFFKKLVSYRNGCSQTLLSVWNVNVFGLSVTDLSIKIFEHLHAFYVQLMIKSKWSLHFLNCLFTRPFLSNRDLYSEGSCDKGNILLSMLFIILIHFWIDEFYWLTGTLNVHHEGNLIKNQWSLIGLYDVWQKSADHHWTKGKHSQKKTQSRRIRFLPNIICSLILISEIQKVKMKHISLYLVIVVVVVIERKVTSMEDDIMILCRVRAHLFHLPAEGFITIYVP